DGVRPCIDTVGKNRLVQIRGCYAPRNLERPAVVLRYKDSCVIGVAANARNRKLVTPQGRAKTYVASLRIVVAYLTSVGIKSNCTRVRRRKCDLIAANVDRKLLRCLEFLFQILTLGICHACICDYLV